MEFVTGRASTISPPSSPAELADINLLAVISPPVNILPLTPIPPVT